MIGTTLSKMNATFAIAVCTFNPDSRLISRLLESISLILESSAFNVEVILIDNNSNPSLRQDKSVSSFLEKYPKSKFVVESRQGLTAARCCAIKNTSSSIVVFFDDDNEPRKDYLDVLLKYFIDFPHVGIWGPGEITVEYVDSVHDWFYRHPEKFQQRKRGFGYCCLPATWGPYFPNGTGFAVKREILNYYLLSIETGKLSTNDRKGRLLSSAGDVQVVWEGIKLGFAVGLIPELKCKHLITGSKANFAYLKKLSFGTASSYLPALLESFPQQKSQICRAPTLAYFYKNFIKFTLKTVLFPWEYYQIQLEFAKFVGSCYGHALALNLSASKHFLYIAKKFNLV
ncbi:hypothetical protein C8255_12485 [filamentous cyanobacterium CCP3]|nr:hypothetical protein C8255_12485 [filamentous cyanobacterium CCP3]